MIQSKQILNASGMLDIHKFKFKVMEDRKNRNFYSSGTSKTVKSVRNSKNWLIKNAIHDGVKKIFPSGTVTPYDVLIMSYDIVYYVSRYQIIYKPTKKGKDKYYERWRDKEAKRTHYSVISAKKEYSPEQEGYGIMHANPPSYIR